MRLKGQPTALTLGTPVEQHRSDSLIHNLEVDSEMRVCETVSGDRVIY